jgi:site-specific recombinase XerD
MSISYGSPVFSDDDIKTIKGTELSLEDKLDIDELKAAFKKRSYCPAIEQLFILHKNNYPASRIAEIYGMSVRRTQEVLKELGLGRSISEGRIISPNVNRGSKDGENTADSKRRIPIDQLELPQSLDDFLNYLNVIKAKSPNTINGYRNDLILFFRFMKKYKKLCPRNAEIGVIEIKEIDSAFLKAITLMDLYAFLAFLENERSNSSYARARKVASLKSFFKFLHTKAKILDDNPTADLESPKINKRHPVYLTLDESKNLLNSVAADNKHHLRDYCIITLFLNCGLRLSELCSINISSIKGDTLTIIGKGNKERTVYLNKACIRAISDYMNEREQMSILPSHRDALFISERKTRINMRTVEKIVKKYIADAGLDKDKYSPHKLRHTAATLMYKHGNVDIRSLQLILGHENINTTQIYTHVDDEKLRNAVSSNPLSEE